MSERAEKLREAVREAVILADVVNIHGDAYATWDKTTDKYNGWPDVLRAIVQELGITRENVYTLDEIAHCADLTSNAARDVHAIVERLATLLDAAEVGP